MQNSQPPPFRPPTGQPAPGMSRPQRFPQQYRQPHQRHHGGPFHPPAPAWHHPTGPVPPTTPWWKRPLPWMGIATTGAAVLIVTLVATNGPSTSRPHSSAPAPNINDVIAAVCDSETFANGRGNPPLVRSGSSGWCGSSVESGMIIIATYGSESERSSDAHSELVGPYATGKLDDDRLVMAAGRPWASIEQLRPLSELGFDVYSK